MLIVNYEDILLIKKHVPFEIMPVGVNFDEIGALRYYNLDENELSPSCI